MYADSYKQYNRQLQRSGSGGDSGRRAAAADARDTPASLTRSFQRTYCTAARTFKSDGRCGAATAREAERCDACFCPNGGDAHTTPVSQLSMECSELVVALLSSIAHQPGDAQRVTSTSAQLIAATYGYLRLLTHY